MQLIAKTSEAKPMLVAETAPAVSQGGQRAVRICLPTWRKFTRKAFQCGWYEAQDVLAETTGADLIPVEANLGFRDREALQRRLLYHDISRRLVHVNPGLRKIRLTENYDVFIAVCQTHSDFLYINALENWQDRCGTSILWIDELWAKRIPLYKYWLHAIKRFDHIFIAAYGSVEALSERLGKQCHWLPSAVDAARFCPYPVTPERVIDVYSIGRRLPAVHKVILRLAEERGLFYVHDTASGADMDAFDQKEHRIQFANRGKRSRYFMVGAGKLDDHDETGGQIEFGQRYYEGAAAGAVLLGQVPQTKAFEKMFDWPDAVIELNPDGSDVKKILEQLDADPERISEISRRNSRQALLRHDWIYRWMEMFRIAGLDISSGMRAREQELQSLAALAGCAS